MHLLVLSVTACTSGPAAGFTDRGLQACALPSHGILGRVPGCHRRMPGTGSWVWPAALGRACRWWLPHGLAVGLPPGGLHPVGGWSLPEPAAAGCSYTPSGIVQIRR